MRKSLRKLKIFSEMLEILHIVKHSQHECGFLEQITRQDSTLFEERTDKGYLTTTIVCSLRAREQFASFLCVIVTCQVVFIF